MNTVSAPGSVVVGVDGSQAGLDAVRWAAAEARGTQCPLSLVHTLEWPLVSYPVPAGLRADWTQEMHEQGHRWLQEAQEAAELAAPGVPTQVHLCSGDPRERLLAEAQHARELVVGSRGLGGFAGMLLGSTSATVTQHASCPVVVVHGQGNAAGPVVVGLDGSAASEPGLGYAVQAAARAGATLRAVHAWEDLGALHSPIAPAETLPVKEIEAAALRMLAEQLASWQEKYPDIVVEGQVIHERPAAALIELGHAARMIVVGSAVAVGSPDCSLARSAKRWCVTRLARLWCAAAIQTTDTHARRDPGHSWGAFGAVASSALAMTDSTTRVVPEENRGQ